MVDARQRKWDHRFLYMAKFFSSWSKDPSTKVGAVITKNVNEIVSLGYNGFPADDPDLESDYNDRDKKYTKVVHGEMNALRFARERLNWWDLAKAYLLDIESTRGYTLYTYPFMPCDKCAKKIADAEFYRVVSLKNDNPRWQKSFEKSLAIFDECSIEVKLYNAIEVT